MAKCYKTIAEMES